MTDEEANLRSIDLDAKLHDRYVGTATRPATLMERITAEGRLERGNDWVDWFEHTLRVRNPNRPMNAESQLISAFSKMRVHL